MQDFMRWIIDIQKTSIMLPSLTMKQMRVVASTMSQKKKNLITLLRQCDILFQ